MRGTETFRFLSYPTKTFFFFLSLELNLVIDSFASLHHVASLNPTQKSSRSISHQFIMPSVKNPNGPSKNRIAARAATARKQNQKRNAGASKKSRVEKADTTRGARDGLLPTSGPNAALSSKKRRKLERKLGYAVKRKMEAEGEVEMKGRVILGNC